MFVLYTQYNMEANIHVYYPALLCLRLVHTYSKIVDRNIQIAPKM